MNIRDARICPSCDEIYEGDGPCPRCGEPFPGPFLTRWVPPVHPRPEAVREETRACTVKH